MIINIRGTSGSGKTYLMRKLIKHYSITQPVMHPGRRNPLYYTNGSGSKGISVAVLGSYETTCGGCDTIQGYEMTMGIIATLRKKGFVVLYEGLLLSADVKQISMLAKKFPGEVHALALSTPFERCIQQVNARRAARGNTEPVNPANTEAKFRGVIQSLPRLVANGVQVYSGSTETLFRTTKELISNA